MAIAGGQWPTCRSTNDAWWSACGCGAWYLVSFEERRLFCDVVVETRNRRAPAAVLDPQRGSACTAASTMVNSSPRRFRGDFGDAGRRNHFSGSSGARSPCRSARTHACT
ncbi:MAG TPA: hypothetical protein VF062_17860, partial [Candidatus Limnocylindrales bacterium]